MTIALAVIALATFAAVVSRTFRTLHMLQLEGYRVERYLRHSWERFSIRDNVLVLAVGVATLSLGILGRVAGINWAGYVLVLVWAAEASLYTWSVCARPAKKPFAMTARMGRLVTATIVLSVAAVVIAVLVLVGAGIGRFVSAGDTLAWFVASAALVLLQPVLVVAAVSLLEPVEAAIRRRFLNKARVRLREIGPLVIGIAGSYGKTTTKSALTAALSRRFRVIASPESFNTLLGVARTINEELLDDTEVLIVEMGARQIGDIAEICDLVRPTVGIITRLGPQHLEYFKTEESVVVAKTELLRALPTGALAVVDADGLADFVDYEGSEACIVRLSTREDAHPDVHVGGVSIGGNGTTFDVQLKGVEGRVEARTPLLGRHAAVNCAIAIATAHGLGVEIDEIRKGIESMPVVPHRLQIVRNDSVVVIDDAFSSNPDGFAAALEVLGSIEGRRILVTPGMVELGLETVPAHQRIAAIAAGVCNTVILVGKTYPKEFASTLVSAGLPQRNLRLASSLADATEMLGQIVEAGDVVLFENDLPDNFA